MLKEARLAMAAKVRAAIPGLQMSDVMLAEPTAPGAHVFPSRVDYDETFQRGVDNWPFTLQAFVGTAGGDRAAQENLDAYIEPSGEKSVKAALEVPDTEDSRVSLGGIIHDLRVVRCEGYRIYQREGKAPVLGSEWLIEVSAPGEEEE